MSTATLTTPAAVEIAPNYLNWRKTVASWLLTTDHKRIGVLYLLSITAFFVVGGLYAAAIRLELLTPAADLLQKETYNRAFTMHGIVMIFFFLVPSIPAVLGNFLVPMMIGARDMAFPKLNLLSWYVYMAAGVFAVTVLALGGVDTGWTFYTPYSSMYAGTHVALMGIGVFIAGFSSILTGINFIVTVHKMRAPGLTWFRLPLFIWAHYATSIIFVLGTPVLAITVLLVALERLFKFPIFDPSIGGDPVLFQHLFWFYSHPAVYIMILPGMGVMSEVIACFAKRRIFGYTFVALASLAIALLGFLLWGHHMFVSSQSAFSGLIFSMLSFLVAIPSAIKVFNWTATLYKGHIDFETPLLYAFGFLGLFTVGGLTGLFLASPATDVPLHDTYFVVAHFHFIMVGGMVMAFMAGLHFWWPKITGRMYPYLPSIFSALMIFVGFILTFMPQFQLGHLGMPRRYAAYDFAPEFQIWHVLSTGGAAVLGLGYLLPMLYLPWSLVAGKRVGPNPWGAKGLEWTTPSPPPAHNFREVPTVTEEAYAYTGEERNIAREAEARG